MIKKLKNSRYLKEINSMTTNDILVAIAVFLAIILFSLIYLWYYLMCKRERNMEEFIKWAIERDFKEVRNKTKKEYKDYTVKNPVLTKEQVDRINKNMKEKN